VATSKKKSFRSWSYMKMELASASMTSLATVITVSSTRRTSRLEEMAAAVSAMAEILSTFSLASA